MIPDHSTQSEQDTVPEITLRIPGPWESPEQLQDALAKSLSNYLLPTPAPGSEMSLLHEPDGQRFRLSAAGPDDEIVDLFAGPGRLSPQELKALQNHNVKVFVTGPGGSLEAARTFLAIGAAFIKAGALGVMVDNSGTCHGPRDWLALAADEAMGGMYWAFVSVTADDQEAFSAGMHCLGYRDAELRDPVDPKAAGMMLHEFLGYSYQSGAALVDGDPIGSPDGPEFILRHVECTRFPKHTPWHNPYGVWRLEKVAGGEE